MTDAPKTAQEIYQQRGGLDLSAAQVERMRSIGITMYHADCGACVEDALKEAIRLAGRAVCDRLLPPSPGVTVAEVEAWLHAALDGDVGDLPESLRAHFADRPQTAPVPKDVAPIEAPATGHAVCATYADGLAEAKRIASETIDATRERLWPQMTPAQREQALLWMRPLEAVRCITVTQQDVPEVGSRWRHKATGGTHSVYTTGSTVTIHGIIDGVDMWETADFLRDFTPAEAE